MAFPVEGFFLVFLSLLVSGVMLAEGDAVFDENYRVAWGNDHAVYENGGRQMMLYLDIYTGAGFQSKRWFGSGFFRLRIKVPKRDCAGVITAFFLRSEGQNTQDELDFEFLGNREGKPITLQTNVITGGTSRREQRTLLWFDPTADFHDYKILWNHHQIVFFIDNIPIRVFRNNRKIKVPYLLRPMRIDVSIWDGSDWATDGGQTKTDYNHAPFRAYFQGFDIDGCTIDNSMQNDVKECYATKYLWNHKVHRELDATQKELYHFARGYMNYDYCNDRPRFPTPPPECSINS